MSQENVEIVRAAMEDFAAGKTEFDADGTLTRLAGEARYHAADVRPGAAISRR